MDLGGPKIHALGGGPGPTDEWAILGALPCPIMKYIGNIIRREPKLFVSWQQRCGLSLSVLQQLVIIIIIRTHPMYGVQIVVADVRCAVCVYSLFAGLDIIMSCATAAEPIRSRCSQWRSHTSSVRGVRTPCQENTYFWYVISQCYRPTRTT